MADGRLGARLHALADALRASPEPWRADAACHGRTATMYPTGAPGIADAVAVCAGCVVLEPCRTWALSRPDPVPGGVAGGLTERQRAAVRADRRRLAG